MNTANFIKTVSNEAKTMILSSIAKHYGITEQEAFEEVTDDDAEHLLDYMTGSERSATSILMKKHGFN